MNVGLFIKISKFAHKLTKVYKAKYTNISYKAQFGIFFKLLYSMYKSKVKTEKCTKVAAKTIFQKFPQLYKSITNKKVDYINFFVAGKGLNLQWFTSTVTNGLEEYQTGSLRSITELLNNNMNVLPLIL